MSHYLTKYPETIITLAGFGAGDTQLEKDTALTRARAESVKKYLVEIWRIAPVRISIERPTISKLRQANESRRVRVTTDSWELYKPIFYVNRGSSSRRECYAILDFQYASANMGSQNERIVSEYLLPRMAPGRQVTITGFVDADGLNDKNYKLGESRAKAVRDLLRKLSKTDSIDVRSEPDFVSQGSPASDFMIARRVEIVIENPPPVRD